MLNPVLWRPLTIAVLAANMTMAEALGLALAVLIGSWRPGLLCAQGCVSAGVGAGSD